eukprot:1142301-Rhodomonas_salina.2
MRAWRREMSTICSSTCRGPRTSERDPPNRNLGITRKHKGRAHDALEAQEDLGTGCFDVLLQLLARPALARRRRLLPAARALRRRRKRLPHLRADPRSGALFLPMRQPISTSAMFVTPQVHHETGEPWHAT